MTDTRDVFLCDAVRTPIGRYGGALAKVRTDDLAAVPIRALVKRHPKVDWSALDEVVFGCANQAGEDNRNVARMGLATKGPTKLVTDLAIFEPDPVTKEMTVTSIHPGVTRDAIKANTGWPVRYAADVTETPAPTEQELSVLRELHARTARAHGDAA